MAKKERVPEVISATRVHQKRGRDVVELAAEISGRSQSMVYQVMAGKATSKFVALAIAEARRRLRQARPSRRKQAA